MFTNKWKVGKVKLDKYYFDMGHTYILHNLMLNGIKINPINELGAIRATPPIRYQDLILLQIIYG